MTYETYYPRKSDFSVVAYAAWDWESVVFRTGRVQPISLELISLFCLYPQSPSDRQVVLKWQIVAENCRVFQNSSSWKKRLKCILRTDIAIFASYVVT